MDFFVSGLTTRWCEGEVDWADCLKRGKDDNVDLRDWSLITGRGATKREGGGAREVFCHAEGGAQKVLG